MIKYSMFFYKTQHEYVFLFAGKTISTLLIKQVSF